MGLICEDLSAYGVVLVPPDNPRYFDLLFDIERRLHNRPKGWLPPSDEELSRIGEHDSKASAILLNEARVAIVSVAYIWWVPTRQGVLWPQSHLPGTSASVLLPYLWQDRAKKFDSYWQTIFAGSKRLLSFSHSGLLGDNSDVRPPAADELLTGGYIVMTGGGGWGEPAKLTLDGVFFEDGGFAGPNRMGAFESAGFAAQAYQDCSTLAREARRKGAKPDEFFPRVRGLMGHKDDQIPVPPPPLFSTPNMRPFDPDRSREYERANVGWIIGGWLRELGDEGAMQAVASWADMRAPEFHKL